MDDSSYVIKYQGRKLTKAITTWVGASTHVKYQTLTQFNVRTSEHLRQVIERELDRLIEIEGLRNPEMMAALELKDQYE